MLQSREAIGWAAAFAFSGIVVSLYQVWQALQTARAVHCIVICLYYLFKCQAGCDVRSSS